jgi:hypothetical protein
MALKSYMTKSGIFEAANADTFHHLIHSLKWLSATKDVTGIGSAASLTYEESGRDCYTRPTAFWLMFSRTSNNCFED